MANNNANVDPNDRRWASIVTYGECIRNFCARRGRYVTDGCMEFMRSGEERTPEAFICAACHCHRNYHRAEEVSIQVDSGMQHMLHNMATNPVPPPHVPVLGAYPMIIPPPPPPPPAAEEHIGDGEIVEQEPAGPAEPRRRRGRPTRRR